MSTPEGPPKNYISTGINKSLLTPCRRVGLSRIKRTPQNLGFPLGTHATTPTTPLENTGTHKTKEKTTLDSTPLKPHFSLQNTADTLSGNSKVEPNSISKTPKQEPKKAKKRTLECDIKLEHGSNLNNEKPRDTINSKNAKGLPVSKAERPEEDSPTHLPLITKVTAQIHHSNIKCNINFDADCQPTGNMVKEKPEVLQETKTLTSSSDCDDYTISKKKKRRVKVLSSNSSDDGSICVKSCDCECECESLSRFTTEEYLKDSKSLAECFENVDVTDFENDNVCSTENIKKEYMALYCPISITQETEIEKNCNENKPLLDRKLTVSLEKIKQNNTKTKQTSNCLQNKIHHTATFDTEESEEEMFTSSPESDKKQRENLIILITNMQKVVKQKEETLEKLKHAQIYKNKHSPANLNKSTDLWKKACEESFRDLLQKLQEHAPINVDTLIKQLGIPDFVVNKLNLR